MNNIVANMLLHMTSSSRFDGSLNVDVNEITMNLVPFPRMHFLVSSLTPLYALADVHIPPRRSVCLQVYVCGAGRGWEGSVRSRLFFVLVREGCCVHNVCTEGSFVGT